MKRIFFLRESNGNEFEAWLESIEGNQKKLILTYRDKILSKTADDYFSALNLIRRELEKDNILIVCNGASKDVYPSPMMRDMGDGDLAYRLKLGYKAKREDIVNIFDVDKDKFIPSTVDEQEKYYNEWLTVKKIRKTDEV